MTMHKLNQKKSYESIFFKNEKLAFVEARFVKNSSLHYHKHFHDTLSIGAIEEGQVLVYHNKEEYTLKPHELIVINPNIGHSCNPIKNEARTYHMIYIDPLWYKGIQETLFGNLKSYIPISKLKIQDKKLFTEFITLNYILLDDSIFFLKKEELLQNFLIKLFTKYCSKSPTQNNDSIHNTAIIKSAKEYIKNNVNNNITVKEISDYLNISEFYFFKLFKEESCITPHAFLLNCKILKAKKLLSQNKNISDIAYELGFSDQSHFNRIFKQYVAATPFEYKKSILK